MKLLDFESLDSCNGFGGEDARRIGVATLELFGGWFTTFVSDNSYASTSGKYLLLTRLRAAIRKEGEIMEDDEDDTSRITA